eukprot:2517447-Alexandrium_andersonii.AAC.1
MLTCGHASLMHHASRADHQCHVLSMHRESATLIAVPVELAATTTAHCHRPSFQETPCAPA